MKDLLKSLPRWIVFLNSITQLALSQVHILATTKIFKNEIGFYLFFFVIFGLVTGFNTFLLEKRRGIIFFSVSCWVSSLMGFIYLRLLEADVAAQEVLTMADVKGTWVLVIVAICINLAASVIIPILHWGDVKEDID